jgi:2-keto-4-pentenoate hydratase/2-oxohepta-3-ene-1,7-dioic acid hydratase in catechol pathway
MSLESAIASRISPIRPPKLLVVERADAVEVAAVVGRTGSNLSTQQAQEHIAATS